MREHHVRTRQAGISNDDFSEADTDSNYRTDFVAEGAVMLGIIGLESQARRDRIRGPVERGE